MIALDGALGKDLAPQVEARQSDGKGSRPSLRTVGIGQVPCVELAREVVLALVRYHIGPVADSFHEARAGQFSKASADVLRVEWNSVILSDFLRAAPVLSFEIFQQSLVGDRHPLSVATDRHIPEERRRHHTERGNNGLGSLPISVSIQKIPLSMFAITDGTKPFSTAPRLIGCGVKEKGRPSMQMLAPRDHKGPARPDESLANDTRAAECHPFAGVSA